MIRSGYFQLYALVGASTGLIDLSETHEVLPPAERVDGTAMIKDPYRPDRRTELRLRRERSAQLGR